MTTQNDEYSLGRFLVGEYQVLLYVQAIVCMHSCIQCEETYDTGGGNTTVSYLARVARVTCIDRRLITPDHGCYHICARFSLASDRVCILLVRIIRRKGYRSVPGTTLML